GPARGGLRLRDSRGRQLALVPHPPPPPGARPPAPPETPRYEELLEAARHEWWDSANFDKWKSHYISEYDRGRSLVELLRGRLPDLELGGLRVLDVGCGDAGVLIALAEAGADAHGIEPFEPSVL